MNDSWITEAVYDAETEWRPLCVLSEPLSKSEANAFAGRIYAEHAPEFASEFYEVAREVFGERGTFVVQGDTKEYVAQARDQDVITVKAFPVEAATIVHECAHVLVSLDHYKHSQAEWRQRVFGDIDPNTDPEKYEAAYVKYLTTVTKVAEVDKGDKKADPDGDDDAHGVLFRTWHLRLVRRYYRDDAADLLAEIYDDYLSEAGPS